LVSVQYVGCSYCQIKRTYDERPI